MDTARTSWGSDLKDLTPVLLVGGLGTRLRSVLGDVPKALATVAGRPMLSYLLDRIVAAGIRTAVLATGWGGDQLREAFGNNYGPLALVYSQEPAELGTAGAIRYAMPMLRSDPVLVLNGDSWCDLDLLTFLSWHRARRAQASIWLARPDAACRYGQVKTDSLGSVLSFEEKGTGGNGWINAGVYLLSRTFVEAIPPDRPVSLEREIFPGWIGRGLYAYPGAGRFLDIGTPDSYRQATSFFAQVGESGKPHAPAAYPGLEPVLSGSPRRFVVLDRDGTINVERHYLSNPDELELLPGAAEGLKRLKQLGLGLIVITNQSAIGRGYFDEVRLTAIHARLVALLREHGVELDGIYHCPHRPDENCECRKPGLAMVQQAAQALAFRLDQAFFIGDNLCDIEMGRRAGARTILVRTGYGEETLQEVAASPDFAVDNLLEAARIIDYLLSADQIDERRAFSRPESRESVPVSVRES